MYSWDRWKFVECKSMPLVEEIGQVSYIFSDKTGTLTRNVMEFKYMLIGQEFYGDENEFTTGRPEQGENEALAFKRRETMAAEKSKSKKESKDLDQDEEK